jgi:TolB-like protein
VKNYRILFLLLAAALLVSAVPGCNTPPDPKYKKDGTQYGVTDGLFRDRWWNYYERGLSFSDGEFWKEAAEDFREALRQRDSDQRRARTYGMHFADYFPHRDLGVALYHLGRFEEARRELETSLAAVETAKAKFYLNRVRKAIVAANNADTARPSIKVSSVPADAVSNSFSMTLEGEVADDTYAEKVAVNEDPVFVELSAKRIPFSRKIRLKKGLNEIKIKSTDLMGKESEKTVTVYGDYQGPLVNVRNYADGQKTAQGRVVLHGSLADATGITTFKINEQVLAYNKEREVDFTFAVNLEQGSNEIMLAATDTAGNTTRGALNLVYVPRLAEEPAPEKPLYAGEPIRVALQGSGVLDTGQHRLYAAARPGGAAGSFRLNLKDLAETQTVYYKTMYIDGSVTGRHPVESVSVNGDPLMIIPGKTIYFNEIIELDEGENTLTITVEDKQGNTESRTVTILRRVPSVHQVDSRMSIAILPFEKKGEISPASDIIYDNLISSFFDQNRFHIVSRGEELESVLREQKLSRTDLVDKRAAVELGRMVAAEAVLMGSIRETADAVEIYARMVNTETSSLLEVKDVYGQDKSLASLQYLTNGLALKFVHSFPLVEGMVLKVDGDTIYADFGTDQQIKKEMKFIVFREGEKIIHPVTGRVLGSNTEKLGVARVVNVFEDMSLGKLVADIDHGLIKQKDLIITK